MYAIIETGGKQYTVQEGDTLRVEKLQAQEGDTVTFDRVLVLGGEDFKVGTPYVENASVKAEVKAQDKAKKIVIGKYKAKKGYRRRQGHRQPYTLITIESIEG